ncbi:DUF1007 family protein, partial [bacterium]|nr:DUF1007 family protein [bacterium]
KTLSAHPHTFIDQRVNIAFDDKGLAGFKVRWVFDDMFSAMIAGDYDQNRNGSLEPEEVGAIKKGAFAYLAVYNYFILINIEGTPFEVKFVKDFSAKLADNRLVYNFFVPCHVRAVNNYKQITFTTNDPTNYSSLLFDEKHPIKLDNAETFEVKNSGFEDKLLMMNVGAAGANSLSLEFRLK